MSVQDNSPGPLYSYFENIPDMVCSVGREGIFKTVNQAFVNKLGFSKEELLTEPILSFIFPEDRATVRDTFNDLFLGKPIVVHEVRFVTHDGKVIWLSVTAFYIPGSDSLLGLAKEITQKKKVEHFLEKKYESYLKLARHFKENMEEDRQKIAIELHEELAQLAAVIKLNLTSVKKTVPDLPQIAMERIDLAADLSDLLISTIRKLSFEISPYMLEYNSLEDALSTLCNDFSKVHGILCEMEIDFEEDSLSKEIKMDFFRICQIALKNVWNHSRATKVTIRIAESEEKAMLSIIDNGVGFDVKKMKSGSGISLIEDRVSSIDGKLLISSKPGEGTLIRVEVSKSGQ